MHQRPDWADEKLVDPDCANGKHRSCVGGLCECSCHWTDHSEPPAAMTTYLTLGQQALLADLDAKLAAEEHHQGRPYTAEPDHCHRCAEVDLAWAQAVCEHDGVWVIDIPDLCGRPDSRHICNQCGLEWMDEQ